MINILPRWVLLSVPKFDPLIFFPLCVSRMLRPLLARGQQNRGRAPNDAFAADADAARGAADRLLILHPRVRLCPPSGSGPTRTLWSRHDARAGLFFLSPHHHHHHHLPGGCSALRALVGARAGRSVAFWCLIWIILRVRAPSARVFVFISVHVVVQQNGGHGV